MMPMVSNLTTNAKPKLQLSEHITNLGYSHSILHLQNYFHAEALRKYENMMHQCIKINHKAYINDGTAISHLFREQRSPV
jgi:ssRNA-specific RNase YbeY (16S rRNA maturation enzyme)